MYRVEIKYFEHTLADNLRTKLPSRYQHFKAKYQTIKQLTYLKMSVVGDAAVLPCIPAGFGLESSNRGTKCKLVATQPRLDLLV